jgi:hypothetical protein
VGIKRVIRSGLTPSVSPARPLTQALTFHQQITSQALENLKLLENVVINGEQGF